MRRRCSRSFCAAPIERSAPGSAKKKEKAKQLSSYLVFDLKGPYLNITHAVNRITILPYRGTVTVCLAIAIHVYL